MLDSNVFFNDYKCLEKFDGAELYIPIIVVEELCKHKSDSGLSGYNVRKSLKEIEKSETLSIVLDYSEIPDFDLNINDNKIIASAHKYGCKLVSDDIDIRIKARKYGLTAEEYHGATNIKLGELRKGVHEIHDNELLQAIYTTKKPKKADYMYENDFVKFLDKDGDICEIARVKDGKIQDCKLYDKKFNGMLPRSLEQKMALTHLFDNNLELVTFSGGFGSSKTFLMLGMALELVEKGAYNKIYIAKAPISLDKNIETGFKKGEFLSGKMALPLGSITTNLFNMKKDKNDKMVTGMDLLEGYINFGKVEVLSLEDILGMSLMPKSILLVEEAQTLTEKVSKALYSRIGDNGVIFANGDLAQSSGNNLIAEDTGFFKLINAFAGYEKSAHMTLMDIQRSNFAKELTKRWV